MDYLVVIVLLILTDQIINRRFQSLFYEKLSPIKGWLASLGIALLGGVVYLLMQQLYPSLFPKDSFAWYILVFGMIAIILSPHGERLKALTKNNWFLVIGSILLVPVILAPLILFLFGVFDVEDFATYGGPLVLLSLILGLIFGFLRLLDRRNERYRRVVRNYMSAGLTLQQAIEKAFSDINMNYKLGLRPSTIKAVAQKFVNVERQTKTEYILDVYAELIQILSRTYKWGLLLGIEKWKGVTDEEVIDTLETLYFAELEGKTFINPAFYDEILKKYPR